MVVSIARISAALGMKVDDYYSNGKRWWLRLNENRSAARDLRMRSEQLALQGALS